MYVRMYVCMCVCMYYFSSQKNLDCLPSERQELMVVYPVQNVNTWDVKQRGFLNHNMVVNK